MLEMQTQEQQKVTIVGTVYETMTVNGESFQRKVEQKQREEKLVEQAQRRREVLEPNSSTQDVVSLSDAATQRAQEDANVSEAQDVATTAAPAEAAPAPVRGQAVNTLA